MLVNWFMPMLPESDLVYGVILEVALPGQGKRQWIPSSLPIAPLEVYRAEGPEFSWQFIPDELLVFESLNDAQAFLYNLWLAFEDGLANLDLVEALANRHNGINANKHEFTFLEEPRHGNYLN